MQPAYSLALTYVVLVAAGYLFASVYMDSKRNRFPVVGRCVLITGGSQGMGLAVATLLASKGANVVVVARNEARLVAAVEAMKKAAHNAQIQRFTYVVADVSDATAAAGTMATVTKWNGGQAPDIVWCCAGAATPTLFLDTEPAELQAQMETNYFTAAYTAHAAVRAWVGTDAAAAAADKDSDDAKRFAKDKRPRHLVFTSTVLTFFGVAGYAPYTPPKSAMRGLADTLAMELRLYAGAYPQLPEVQVHTVFPATIYTEGFEHEQTLKSDLCKKLEEDDKGQTPAQVAAAAVKGLERGQELVSTGLMGRALKTAHIAGARNVPVLDRLLSFVMAGVGVLAFVRRDLDKKTVEFGKKFGASGMKKA